MSFGIERRKQRSHEEVDSEGTWAISYGDMITLLLAFFVLFFTVDPQESKEQLLKDSLLAELKKNSSEGNEKKATSGEGDKETDRKPANVNVGQEHEENMTPDIIKRWGGKVYQVGYRIVIDFPEISFFQLGYIDVNNEGRKELERFAKIYLPYAGSYVLGIRAFTDSRKVVYKRRYRDNLELSALRAISAMRALRDFGIPLDRMRLGGYGELKVTHDALEKFKGENSTSDPLSFSRKVVLVIEPEPESKENS